MRRGRVASGRRDEAGDAAELNGVLRCAENRGPDPFGRGQQRCGQRSRGDAVGEHRPEPPTQVTEIPCFRAVYVFGDATGEDDAVHRRAPGYALGQEEAVGGLLTTHGRDDQIGHRGGDFVEAGGLDAAAEVEVQAHGRGVYATAWLDPRHGVAVDGDQSPADVQGRGGQHPAVVDEREFRRPAADVDVEDAGGHLVRRQCRPGAVGRQHRLHVVPGGRTHQVTGPLGDDGGNPLGVSAAQRLTRQDHHAGVHILRLPAGVAVCRVEHPAQCDRVDLQIVRVRGQVHIGLEQRVPGHHDVATGQILTAPAQLQPRERHLRSRTADVDADAVQGDVVLLPDRIVLERQVRLVVLVIVIVGHACDATGTGSAGFGGRSASSAA